MTASGTVHVQTPIAGLVDLALRDPSLQDVTRRAADRPADLALVGPASARVFAACALAQAGPLLVVTATGREADDLTAELRGVFGDAAAMFPSWETLPHERLSPGVDTVGARLMVLRRLANPDDERLGPPLRVVVTTVRSLLQPMAPDLGDIEPVTLTVGAEADFDDVIARLVELAYTRVDMVGKRGEFAVRGGILDVFPPTAEHPVRVEFWGDEVSEMRMFSVADQRSIPEIDVDTVIAVPCRELLLTDDVRGPRRQAGRRAPACRRTTCPAACPTCWPSWPRASPSTAWRRCCRCCGPPSCPLLSDHLPAGTPLLVCDPEKVRTRAADLIKTGREFLEASWSTAAVGGDAPIDLEALGASGFVELDDVRSAAREGGHPWWTLSQLSDEAAIELDIRPAPSARGQQSRRRRDLRDAARPRRDRRLRSRRHPWHRHRAPRRRATRRSRYARNDVGAGRRAEGRRRRRAQGPAARRRRDLPGANLVVITETDLTGNRVTAPEGKRLAAKRRNVVDPLALTAGDLVVHDQHGIGRFVEMMERTVGGARREYLVLEYGVEQARRRIRPAVRADGLAGPAVALRRR